MSLEKKRYPYKNIVNGEISNTVFDHPLNGKKDKTYFLKLILKDLKLEDADAEDISDGSNNFFKIKFNGQNLNIFIEHTDGGGADISSNSTRKKVAIPANKTFKKLTENFEKILIVNLYVPLKNEKELDLDNRVYLIIKTDEIYNSKVVEGKTENSSSRWVQLEKIKEVNNSGGFILNRRKNVYVVNKNYLKTFFNEILISEYKNMYINSISELVDNSVEKMDKNSSEEVYTNNISNIRKLFRQLLLMQKNNKCDILNCEIDIEGLLIASHIYACNQILKSKLSEEEKIRQISDVNNGFLLCPNHDKIFDKYLISIDSDGKLMYSKQLQNKIHYFNLYENEKIIDINDENKVYLKHHNKQFNEKINNF